MRSAVLCASSAENSFKFAVRENLRIFPDCFFHKRKSNIVTAVCLYGLSRENMTAECPQAFRCHKN